MMEKLKKIPSLIVLAWKNITIEPVIFLYLTSVGLISVIRPNLLLDKACRIKLNLTDEICDNLSNLNETSEYYNTTIEVQKVVADYETTLSLAAALPRVAFTLLAGPWSDRHGRRLLIIIPIVGQAITALTLILNVKFFYDLPFEALYFEYVNELSGNFVVYYLGVYSYMADITSTDERTARLGILDGMDYISTMFGTYISGPMFESAGYYAIFSASLAFATLGVLYMLIFVKESNRKQEIEPNESTTTYGTEEVQNEVHEIQPENKYCTWSDVWSCIRTVIRKRSNNRRLMIWILLFNFGCFIFAYNGSEGTHRYLFTKLQYGWNEQQYTVFLTAYKVCYLIALWVLLPFCSRVLKLHDATTLILACISGAIGWSLPAIFNGQSWIFVLGFVIASFTPVCTVGSRALISRCVNSDEVGSIFALISVISAISSSLINAAYQAIYSGTLETFPAAFLVINASLMLLTIPNNLFLRKKLVGDSQNLRVD